MASKNGSLSDIPDDFGISYLKTTLSSRKKQKAQTFVSGCYVEKLIIVPDDGKSIKLRGEVYPSVKKSDSRHVVNIEIDTEEKCITDAFCSCKQGNSGTCSHTVAIIHVIEQWKIAGYKDVPAVLSSTSLPQTWDKPRGAKLRPEPVSQMIFARPGNINRKRKPVMANYDDNRKISVTNDHLVALKSLSASPISYLVEEITSETLHVETPIGLQVLGSGLSYHAHLLEPVYHPREEFGCGHIHLPADTKLKEETKAFLMNHSDNWNDVSVTEEESRAIEKNTRLQSSSADWHTQRKKRITASKFGLIMNRKKKVNEAFLKNTFRQAPFVSKPTTHGQENEKTAKVMYVKKTGSHLHDVGLVVHPSFPFLGASPDAIVCSNSVAGLVEIKCPYSARNLTITEAVDKNLKDFCLVRKNENIVLSEKHAYYFQVQGQLLVTGLPYCDFVVYTHASDLFIQRITPNQEVMSTLLKKLAEFYINEFKPFINSDKF